MRGIGVDLWIGVLVIGVALLAGPAVAVGAEDSARIAALEKRLEAQQALIESLMREMQSLKAANAAHDEERSAVPHARGDTQVQVFGKPVVTSDDPRFQVNINGQVHRQLTYAYDGDTAKVYHTDSDNSPTRLNVEAQGKVNDDLTIGGRVETSYQDNRPLRVNQNNENSGFDFSSRWLEVFFDSQRFGRLGVGKGFASSFYFNETDLSGTQIATLLSPGNLFGGLLFYSEEIDDYTDINVSDVFVDLENLSIVNRLRYDSPVFHGFQLSGSQGADQRGDVALRWKKTLGDFQFSGAGSYQVNTLQNSDWRADAVMSVLHQPTGISLTGGGLKAEEKESNRDQDAFAAKLGWRGNLFGFGETRLSADLVRNFDISARNEDGTSIGAFWVQNIKDWGLDVYAGYRYFDVDNPNIDTEAIHLPVIGTRKTF